MANCLAKFFSGTSTVIDKVDFCHIFLFLARTTVRIRLNVLLLDKA